ncbi:MAG: di-trans,poly-cis-decaprenylcistransferase [Candidatus Riflebacteria bacterium]|nr:di-trans,poly-cis-decaprenylcistransferase [Candidatus Riflebacteria bacterium]
MNQQTAGIDRDTRKQKLLETVQGGRIPVHIGIIMDGNGRWAKAHGYSRIRGHQFGARNVKTIVRCADRIGVRHVTLYVFSSENWARPSLEVTALMRLIRTYIARERQELHEEGFCFRMLGRVAGLAPEVLAEARASTELMAGNKGTSLNLCINYGGRAEIVDAVRTLIAQGKRADEIDEAAISSALYAPDIPDPDLIIRTSGELRTSNFLLWQSAYSELLFTPVFWPDFDEVEFLQAVAQFQLRQRRFGKIGEQAEDRKK